MARQRRLVSRWVHTSVVVAVALTASACSKEISIAGEAMAPTLQNGERANTEWLAGTINRGDIVAFRWPSDESKNLVKRIVGLPGERIEMIEGRVSVNGRPIEEPYVVDGNRSRETWEARVIPVDEYFVMGDNRINSSDSRSWGTVKRDLIWGRIRRP